MDGRHRSYPGNVTPLGDADARHDPDGAQLMLDQEGWEVTVVSLDLTDTTLFRAIDLERLHRADTSAERYLRRIVPFYMDFYSALLGERACAMHSGLTVGLVSDPGLVLAAERLLMRVELSGNLTRGKTVADRRAGRKVPASSDWMPEPEVTLALGANSVRRVQAREVFDAVGAAGKFCRDLGIRCDNAPEGCDIVDALSALAVPDRHLGHDLEEDRCRYWTHGVRARAFREVASHPCDCAGLTARNCGQIRGDLRRRGDQHRGSCFHASEIRRQRYEMRHGGFVEALVPVGRIFLLGHHSRLSSRASSASR